MAVLSESTATLPGAFCWLDLAATDVERAQRFYADAFALRMSARHNAPA